MACCTSARPRTAGPALVPLQEPVVEVPTAAIWRGGGVVAAKQRLSLGDGCGTCYLCPKRIEQHLNCLLRRADIALGRKHQPRIHDLRHSFATRALEQCGAERGQVARHFVALSAYTGHVDIRNTYWYLQATPEMMTDIAAAAEMPVGRDSHAAAAPAPSSRTSCGTTCLASVAMSPQTCKAYAVSFRLLLEFAATRTGHARPGSRSSNSAASLIVNFLKHIEQERGNGATTRNLRLAAIKAFMRYVEHHVPSLMAQVGQIDAIPVKRCDQKLIRHLTMEEVRSILNAPDLTTRAGMRDRAMMHLCFAGGLRVSNLISVLLENVALGQMPSVMVRGKGRKERCLPLWKETARDIRALAERARRDPDAGAVRQCWRHGDDAGGLRVRARQARPCCRQDLPDARWSHRCSASASGIVARC